MKKILLGLVLGFILHPSIEEIHDLVWQNQYEICMQKLGPVGNGTNLGTIFKCVYNESLFVRVTEILIYRPMIAINTNETKDE